MNRRGLHAVAAIAPAILGYGALIGAQAPSSRLQRAEQYEATIRRTSYGIPHISGKDFGSLGFGEGYAFAQDHLCSLADQVV